MEGDSVGWEDDVGEDDGDAVGLRETEGESVG